jgi:hypothetical protein
VFEGECVRLDHFANEIEAVRAYDRAVVAYSGEFARLNFPEEWPPERRQAVYAQCQAKEGKGRKAKCRTVAAGPAAPTRECTKRL